MKKIFLCLMIGLCSIGLFACGSKTMQDNISEITTIYFVANEGQVSGSISVGKRENPYVIDGLHNKTLDFSLVVVNFNEVMDISVDVTLDVNGNISPLTLELNPSNLTYMADLGYALKADDEIKIIAGEKELKFSNISKDFEVDHEKAIEIAKENLAEKITSLTEKGDFKGECYLKILTGDDGLFWAFTLVDRENNVYNVVISVEDGSVIYTN